MQWEQPIRLLRRWISELGFESHVGHFASFPSSVFKFMLMKVHEHPSGALKPTSCNFQWFWSSESGLAAFLIRSQYFFCNHQILRDFCWTEKVLLSYLAHSPNAGSPLISLSSISHISSRSQPSILPLFNLHSQFPILINSNFFPSYSSLSLWLEVHYKKHSPTHPRSLGSLTELRRRNDADKFLRVGGAEPVETERREVAKTKWDITRRVGKRGNEERGVTMAKLMTI